MSHISVLLEETLQYLVPDGHEVHFAIDGTLGAGGHTRALLEAGVDELMSFDLDLQAIAIATENLRDFQERVHLVHDSYVTMAQHAKAIGRDSADAILLDLGVSSMQFDTADRVSLFDLMPRSICASTRIVIQLRLPILSIHGRIVRWRRFSSNMAKKKYSRKLARDIVKQRPFETTQRLADVIANAMPERHKLAIHPATRIFQALRIAVNDELQSIEKALPDCNRYAKIRGTISGD